MQEYEEELEEEGGKSRGGGGKGPSLKQLARNPLGGGRKNWPGTGGVAYRKRMFSPSYLKAAQSGKPQAVLKIISSAQGVEVRRTMMYIARAIKKDDKAIDLFDQDGNTVSGKGEINDRWREWRKDFTYRKLSNPNAKNRHSRHILLSVKCENTPQNLRRIEAAASEWLRKNFADLGYEYVFGVHGTDKDAGHPHVHIVMKQRNNQLKKNLDIGPKDLFLLRGRFSEDLEAYGIESVATARQEHLAADIIKGVERLRASGSRLEATRKRILDGNDGNEISARMQLVKGLDRLEKKILRDDGSLMTKAAKKAGLKEVAQIREGVFRVSKNQRRQFLESSIGCLDGALAGLKADVAVLADAWSKSSVHKKEAIGKQPGNKQAAERIFYGIEDAKSECLAIYSGDEQQKIMGALVEFDLAIRESIGEIKEVDQSLGR